MPRINNLIIAVVVFSIIGSCCVQKAVRAWQGSKIKVESIQK